MRAIRGIYWAAAVGASALALTACSGGEEGEKEPTERVSIMSLLGAPSYDSADANAQQRAIEEAVAVCMREEGWEYIPVEYPGMDEGVVEYSEEDELERINREGMGVVYWTLHNDSDDPAYTDDFSEWVDPNQEYVESLTEAEMTAYYESLYGTEEEQEALSTVEVDEETGEEYTIMTGAGAGCQGDAYREIAGDDPTQDPAFWDAAQPFFDEMYERLEADPRVAESNKKWAACMKEAGYDYKDQGDFFDSTYTEFDKRQQEVLGEDFYADPLEGMSQDEIDEFFANATPEELDALYAPPTLTDEQRAALEEILADEIEVALAQFECSKGMNEKMGDIYAEIEEEYALEHEDELRALAASLGSGK